MGPVHMSQLYYLIRSFEAHQRYYPAHYVLLREEGGMAVVVVGGWGEGGGGNGVKEGGNGIN